MGTLQSQEWPPLNTGNGKRWQGWRSKTLFHYVENIKCICSGNHFYIFLINLSTSYKFTLWPICSSPRLYLKEMNKNVHIKIGTCVFTEIVFIIAQTRKPWTGERTDKQNMTFSQNGISFNCKEGWHKPEVICIVILTPCGVVRQEDSESVMIYSYTELEASLSQTCGLVINTVAWIQLRSNVKRRPGAQRSRAISFISRSKKKAD